MREAAIAHTQSPLERHLVFIGNLLGDITINQLQIMTATTEQQSKESG